MFLFCHRYSAVSSAASISGVMLFVSTTKGPIMGSSSLLDWLVVIVAISLRNPGSSILYVWRARFPQKIMRPT